MVSSKQRRTPAASPKATPPGSAHRTPTGSARGTGTGTTSKAAYLKQLRSPTPDMLTAAAAKLEAVGSCPTPDSGESSSSKTASKLPGLTAASGKHLLTGAQGQPPELSAAGPHQASRAGSVSPYAVAGTAGGAQHSRIGAGRSPLVSPLPGATATATYRLAPAAPWHAKGPTPDKQIGRASPAGAPSSPLSAAYCMPAAEVAPEFVDGLSALRRSQSTGGAGNSYSTAGQGPPSAGLPVAHLGAAVSQPGHDLGHMSALSPAARLAVAAPPTAMWLDGGSGRAASCPGTQVALPQQGMSGGPRQWQNQQHPATSQQQANPGAGWDEHINRRLFG
eukprot:gene13541-13667_t